jgi:hypothetical protein
MMLVDEDVGCFGCCPMQQLRADVCRVLVWFAAWTVLGLLHLGTAGQVDHVASDGQKRVSWQVLDVLQLHSRDVRYLKLRWPRQWALQEFQRSFQLPVPQLAPPHYTLLTTTQHTHTAISLNSFHM